ncbi:BatA domain-containing protein [Mangrovimonas sp. YM274]|uniref:BatA domain-containing protein n=1 Tax=Mangrovimonas sp. YM274 TaxID=3070660 RepID=UPI0027DB33B4|nr:BatA domain-containing protein [Mangrovimonas sp. YM274]WMI67227.1 BatA domain-containing protein [Mangrovimonas sp. YM274]
MQFKYPELLYALFLLIIPIIVHLFQLRRFEKVPFTNVQFLKNVTLQTRKSSQIKKWLILITRLLLLTAIIIAFAQPFITKSNNFNSSTETVIYLDNSFSMDAKGKNGTLLNTAVQDLLETVPENDPITFFTNNSYHPNTTIKALRNELIRLKTSSNQLTYEAAVLKGKKAFSNDKSSTKNLVMISDFQEKGTPFNLKADSTFHLNTVQLEPVNTRNVSIDSAYISKRDVENIELTIALNNHNQNISNQSVSLFNNDNLLAKNSVAFEEGNTAIFTLPINQEIDAKLVIDDPNLLYDNTLYFNLNQQDKIKVLSINEEDDAFLGKIFTDDEYEYTSSLFKSLDYNIIEDQNLIVINELKDIPMSLTTALKAYNDNGGNILIIPSGKTNLNTLNQLFTNLKIDSFSDFIESEKNITNINFDHPLFTNVFDKKVSNFQYPKTNSYFTLQSANTTSAILKFEDGSPFLSQYGHVFVFSAPLNDDNSNFKNSPLIVPVIYNIGKQSLKLPQLYYTLGKENTIDINTRLQQDDILSLKSDEQSIIPLQQTFMNKVEMKTNEFPETAGIISVVNNDKTLKKLSFNYDRSESQLTYYNLSSVDGITSSNSVSSMINDIKSASNVNELWKWFVIFAVAFLIIEMLILKFLK